MSQHAIGQRLHLGRWRSGSYLEPLRWAGTSAVGWKSVFRLAGAVGCKAAMGRDDHVQPCHKVSVNDFFRTMPVRAQAIGWAILMGPPILLFILGALFLRPDPIDPRTVWGCYRLEDAPPLLVRPDRIDILDGTGRSFSYLAEPYKEGYRLSVRPALRLERVASDRYGFKEARGIGYFWPLLTAYSDDPRGVRSPDRFGGRISIASDGAPSIYVRSASQERCR